MHDIDSAMVFSALYAGINIVTVLCEDMVVVNQQDTCEFYRDEQGNAKNRVRVSTLRRTGIAGAISYVLLP